MFRRNKAQSSSQVPETTNHEGRLIRKADQLAVLPYLFHDLGIQSNILISATYSHPTTQLTPELIHRTLPTLIAQHPALSIIAINRPSTKTIGHHRTWEAHLPVIKLEDCVQFLNLDLDRDDQLAQVFTDIHNTWFNTNDKTKPFWKVLVINNKTVIWVFHHGIADGLSGYAFHRTFLSALNNPPSENDLGNTTITTPRIDPSSLPSPLDDFDTKLSYLHVLKQFLFYFFVRLFVPQSYLFFHDAIIPPTFPSPKKPFPSSQRTVTQVKILRLDKGMMRKCLQECHAHQTTFTALLHTIIQTTLATEIYPDAHIGLSRLAVAIRTLLAPSKIIDKNTIADGASVYYHTNFLSPYRLPLSQSQSQLYKDKIWALAKKYKQDLNKAIEGGVAIQNFLTAKLIGDDNEDFGSFYGLGLYCNYGFLISNLGAFDSDIGENGGGEERGWEVSEVGFSSGAVRANLGDVGIVFDVSSVKGGDCVVCASWEEGVLSEEMVGRVVEGVRERMRDLFG